MVEDTLCRIEEGYLSGKPPLDPDAKLDGALVTSMITAAVIAEEAQTTPRSVGPDEYLFLM